MTASFTPYRRGQSTLLRPLLATMIVSAMLVGLSLRGTAQTNSCFPTCDTTDGRFLALLGADLESLTPDTIVFSIQVPNTYTSFTLEVFDGETGGLWDKGSVPVVFEVFADPNANGVVDAGETAYGPYSGSDMTDNAWSSLITITTSNDARTDTNAYWYTARMALQSVSVASVWSSFKLRVSYDIVLRTRHFAFAGPVFTNNDAAIIYPNFDPLNPTSTTSLSGSTYDGTWRFHMEVKKLLVFPDRPDTAFIDVWDGDMDFGPYDCSAYDSDDANTPNTPYRPPWATGTSAVPEAVALTNEMCRNASGEIVSGYGTGDPADDNLNLIYRRTPAVTYLATDPYGTSFPNDNPSGNLEWERFSISLFDGVPSVHDDSVSWLSDGYYQYAVTGADLNNVMVWHSTFPFTSVCPDGLPCPPPGSCDTCHCPGAVAGPGYWQEHEANWPVYEMPIGGIWRDSSELHQMIQTTGTDDFFILTQQLVTAKLNLANGAEDSCIIDYVLAADKWVAKWEPFRPIDGGDAWDEIEEVKSVLDAYNNGEMCAPTADELCGGVRGTQQEREKGKSKAKGSKKPRLSSLPADIQLRPQSD